MIGSELGGYRLVRELGSGGMGTVYLAEDAEGRNVAVKVVHSHLLASPGFFKRFLREAELGRKVEHENVVRTLDVDATIHDGQQVNYMVMEYVEGKSLRSLLHDLQTIPETLLRAIALQAAAGLDAIHKAEIVHRDLKPENILITDDQTVRIMDLGVAKLQEASIAITKEGQFAGSLLYAAPEQFGKQPVGPAADLYSLGVLLYELATGQNPFRDDDVAAVIQAHLNLDPPRAGERNPDISLFLSEVIATLLAKAAGDRFESAAVLRTLLEQAERSEWWVERAQRLHAARSHLPRIQVPRATALHARDQDLATLAAAWEAAKEGHGSTVLLEGEAGIGKTRLVDEFVRRLENEDCHVLYGSYPPSGGMGGFSEAILGKFGEAGLAQALRPYLAVTPTLVPSFAALIKHEAAPTAAEPLGGDALSAVMCHLMRALADEKPTLWVLDDLHFAPQESRHLLLALARAAAPHRVLVVATARPGLPEDDLAHLTRLPNLRRIALGRLGAREVIELLRDAFRSGSLAEKLGGKIAYKSDGVPFFVFEMIRGLKEGQFIRQQPDGTYVQTQLITDIEVPSAVKDLIEGRMRGLSENQRAILDVGAVQGASFDPDLVAAILEEKPIRVLRELAEIERRLGLVRGAGELVRFDQNQIQEVLYGQLLPKLRREYHALLAESYAERCGADPVGNDAHFLALHHLRGSRPKKGLPHLAAALDHLEQSYRNDAALTLADLALAHIEGKERVELLFRKAKRLEMVGRFVEMGKTTEEAHRIAEASGDRSLQLSALGTRAVHRFRISDLEETYRLSTQRLELARELGNRREEAAAERGLGLALFGQRLYTKSQEHLQRSLRIAVEIGDRRGEAVAVANLGVGLSSLGDPAGALECHERALSCARELHDRSLEAGTLINIGLTLYRLGRFEEAMDHYERGRTLARECGNRNWEANANIGIGSRLWALGRAAESYERWTLARDMKIEVGERDGEADLENALGHLHLTLGRPDVAQAAIERSLAIARELGVRVLEQGPLISAALCRERAGDVAGAEALYREALDCAREGESRSESNSASVALGRFLLDHGRSEEAMALLKDVAEADEPAAAIARALLGDADGAREALERLGSRIAVPDRMEALFRIGEVEEAHRLLMHLRDHAPEDCRESMIKNVPLHRRIVEASNDRK